MKMLWDVKLTTPPITPGCGPGSVRCDGFESEDEARQWAAHMLRVSNAVNCTIITRVDGMAA